MSRALNAKKLCLKRIYRFIPIASMSLEVQDKPPSHEFLGSLKGALFIFSGISTSSKLEKDDCFMVTGKVIHERSTYYAWVPFICCHRELLGWFGINTGLFVFEEMVPGKE